MLPLLLAGEHWHGWPWLAPFWLLFWAVVIVLVVRLVVGRRRSGGRGPGDPLREARSILAARFARGEIDAEEYRGRLAQLGN